MIPGDAEPDRTAVISTLRHIAAKPTDFTFAEIGAFAGIAADFLEPVQKPKLKKAPGVEGQRTIEDEDPGTIRTKGRPSVYEA